MAVGRQPVTGPAPLSRGIVPALVVASAAGAFEVASVWRTPTVAAVVFFRSAGAAVDLRRCQNDRHVERLGGWMLSSLLVFWTADHPKWSGRRFRFSKTAAAAMRLLSV